ncbi:translation initiation factor IF-2-like [Pteropus medius]|uniref:translation initiation factor IF-2-like n=1 Tax=Pteropus vampyrus TaxID=132908 RepID=UPI00196A7B20|nr:translation initiation factor IF-2-like [Pteropus giganteus]
MARTSPAKRHPAPPQGWRYPDVTKPAAPALVARRVSRSPRSPEFSPNPVRLLLARSNSVGTGLAQTARTSPAKRHPAPPQGWRYPDVTKPAAPALVARRGSLAPAAAPSLLCVAPPRPVRAAPLTGSLPAPASPGRALRPCSPERCWESTSLARTCHPDQGGADPHPQRSLWKAKRQGRGQCRGHDGAGRSSSHTAGACCQGPVQGERSCLWTADGFTVPSEQGSLRKVHDHVRSGGAEGHCQCPVTCVSSWDRQRPPCGAGLGGEGAGTRSRSMTPGRGAAGTAHVGCDGGLFLRASLNPVVLVQRVGRRLSRRL